MIYLSENEWVSELFIHTLSNFLKFLIIFWARMIIFGDLYTVHVL